MKPAAGWISMRLMGLALTVLATWLIVYWGDKESMPDRHRLTYSRASRIWIVVIAVGCAYFAGDPTMQRSVRVISFGSLLVMIGVLVEMFVTAVWIEAGVVYKRSMFGTRSISIRNLVQVRSSASRGAVILKDLYGTSLTLPMYLRGLDDFVVALVRESGRSKDTDRLQKVGGSNEGAGI